MSFLRVYNLLGTRPAPDYYQSLSGGNEEDEKAAAPASSSLFADAELQAKMLEHFENKLHAANEACNNLEAEIKAIDKEPDVIEHLRITAIYHRVGHLKSLQTAEEEMQAKPILLQCYINFNNYLKNAMAHKSQVESCLKTKPVIKNDRIQDLYNQLNKKYHALKKKHGLDEKLATYMGYDKNAADIIAHCKQQDSKNYPKFGS